MPARTFDRHRPESFTPTDPREVTGIAFSLVFSLRANEGAVLDPRHIARVGDCQERVRFLHSRTSVSALTSCVVSRHPFIVGAVTPHHTLGCGQPSTPRAFSGGPEWPCNKILG